MYYFIFIGLKNHQSLNNYLKELFVSNKKNVDCLTLSFSSLVT